VSSDIGVDHLNKILNLSFMHEKFDWKEKSIKSNKWVVNKIDKYFTPISYLPKKIKDEN